MTNPRASALARALGRMARGKPKTLTAAAMAQRRAASLRAAEERTKQARRRAKERE